MPPEEADTQRDNAQGDDARGDDARGDHARGDHARGDDAQGNDAQGDNAQGNDARGNNHIQDVVRRGSAVVMLRGVGSVIGYLFNILLVNVVGTGGAGLYYLALSLKNIASVFSKGGFDNLLVRFVSANVATGEWDKVKGVRHYALRRAALAALFVTGAMMALAWPLAHYVFRKPDLAMPLAVMSLGVVAAAFLELGGASLRGLRRNVASQAITGITVPLLACGILPLLAPALGATGAVLTHVSATALAAILALLAWRLFAPQLRDVEARYDVDELRRTSRPLFHTKLMNLGMTHLPTLLLGAFVVESEVGIFGLALRTALLMSFVRLGLNSILGQKFAAMWKLGELDALSKTVRTATWLAAAIALPILLLFVLAPEWVLAQIKEEVRDGALPLMLLACGQYVNVATGPVGMLLVMSGHERQVRNTTSLSVLLLVVSSLALIPLYGPLGAAIGIAAAMVVKNLTYVFLVRKHLQISLMPFARNRRQPG